MLIIVANYANFRLLTASYLGQPCERWRDGEAQSSVGLLNPGLAWKGAGGWRGEEGASVLLVLG